MGKTISASTNGGYVPNHRHRQGLMANQGVHQHVR